MGQWDGGIVGRDFTSQKNFSDETAKLIDLEVKSLVMGGYNKATEIINENREKLEKLAMALIDMETLTLADIKVLMAGGKLDLDEDAQASDDVDLRAAQKDAEIDKDSRKQDSEGESSGLVGGSGLPDPSPA